MLVQERDNCRQDLEKLEGSLHQVVAKFDAEAKEKYDGFRAEYHDDSPEGQKVNITKTFFPLISPNLLALVTYYFLMNGLFGGFSIE